MKVRAASLAALTLCTLSACSGVHVIRRASYPSLPKSCPLDVVKIEPVELATSSGKWEWIGSVTFDDMMGGEDPFSERVRAKIRPEACAMGGGRQWHCRRAPRAPSQGTLP